MKSLLIFFLWAVIKVDSSSLQSVSDDDLLDLIRNREKLIVLFSKENCHQCDILEKLLENLHDDFQKHMETMSVKAVNSHLARLYNPNKGPALVFFRHGVPLLYSGTPDQNEIFDYFENNQSPAVKELTDKIFEHITQAATGATTGDWFVMFYGASCVTCQRLHAVWEGVGATLKNRINVARIDASGAGLNTAKRFNVNNLPTFLFFRLGKYYKYDHSDTEIKSFVTFAQTSYKNANGRTVPLLASPFDETVDWCVAILKVLVAYGMEILAKHPWIWQISIAGFSLVALTALIALVKAGRSRPAKEVKKEKKRK